MIPYTHIQYKHIISHWSCIRLESLQPRDCHSNTDNWCGRGCDNSQIWQVKCFYLQGKRVPACVRVCLCLFGFVCHMQCAREGSLEHIGVRTQWLIIVANAYSDGSSDVCDSFKAAHAKTQSYPYTHIHTHTRSRDWDLLCHRALCLCWVLNFITDPDK